MVALDVNAQTEKAERLRALHHGGRILVLPNIWDPGGARMLEHLGYPAVATASAAVAYSLGYDDRQQITLDAMLDVVGRVARAVQVPVTADMEWGYAEQPEDVAENMRRVLRAVTPSSMCSSTTLLKTRSTTNQRSSSSSTTKPTRSIWSGGTAEEPDGVWGF